MNDDSPNGSAEQLRHEFDAAFSRPVDDTAEAFEDLLCLRCGGRAVAIRTIEMRGIARCPHITSVPSDAPEMLGISAIRGALYAMYELGSLLGDSEPVERTWVVLCDDTVGLVFDELQGYARVPIAQISRSHDAANQGAHVAIDGVGRPIIDVSALLERIATREGT